MKDEKTMHPYFSEWEPTGDGGRCDTATYETGNYYG